jgi:hypothetical protein
MKDVEPKSVRTAYLFWLLGLFGCLGVHRMYLGKRRSARLWLCTAGVIGLGALADAFLLHWLVQRHNRLSALRALRLSLDDTRVKKREAIDGERYPEAAALRDREVVLLREIRSLKEQLQATSSKPQAGTVKRER